MISNNEQGLTRFSVRVPTEDPADAVGGEMGGGGGVVTLEGLANFTNSIIDYCLQAYLEWAGQEEVWSVSAQ